MLFLRGASLLPVPLEICKDETASDKRGTYSHISDPGDCLCPLTIKHCGYLYQHPYGIISLRQGFLNLSSKYFERNNFTLIGNHTSFPLLTLAAFVWVWHLVDSGIYAPTTREFKALRVKKGRAGPQRKKEKARGYKQRESLVLLMSL